MLDEDTLRKYERAGQIAARVREEMRTTSEGMPILQVCEKAEEIIKRMGGAPAFPCNVSVNEVAAHYTSPPANGKRIPKGAVAKIDIGVHVDGYIADTAVTVCFNPKYEGMVQASQAALETAIEAIRPGVSTSQLGSEIQGVIERHGFRPISNLTGHQIGRYVVHTGKSLPNVSHFSLSKIHAGDVYAVEPFVTVTDAAGKVIESPDSYIFRFVKRRSQKRAETKHLLRFIEKRFRTLPFAERWLGEYGPSQEYKPFLSELLASNCVMAYPMFVEASGNVVAQSEHTVYVDKDRAVVLT